MKFYIISYTLFLFVMSFPFLIYAWTKDDPPIKPPPTTEYDCAHWIKYNGFKLDNYPYNRDKATNRDPSLDKEASTWAAAYAFRIGGLQDLGEIKPEDFCSSFVGNNSVPMKFTALENDEKFCNGWIVLYGFTESINKENFDYIFNMDPSQLNHISIWAYSYYLFLTYSEEILRLSPKEFCLKILSRGIVNIKPFVSKGDSLLTCMDWLEQYDFLEYNAINIVVQQVELLMKNKSGYPLIHLQYFPTTYAEELLDLVASGQMVFFFTQMKFCEKYDGDGDDPKKYPFNYSGEKKEEEEDEEKGEEEEGYSGEE